MERKINDYYLEQKMVFRLGHVRFLKARASLPLHTHPGMIEFVYMERGFQTYCSAGEEYTLRQGEVFYTPPDEFHDTGSAPEERSALYYLILNPILARKLNLFYDQREYDLLLPFSEGEHPRIFRVSAECLGAFKKLEKAFEVSGLHFDTIVRNALSEMLITLAAPTKEQIFSPLDRIRNSLAYIQTHPMEKIKVSELASLDHLSLSAYHRIFMQATGLSPAEYVLKDKIDRAKVLLKETNGSVTNIAYDLGFSSGQYFATTFKRFCNCSPTEYRKA